MFGLELQTFIQMLPNSINVIVLAVVMSKLLYNPVRKILNDRAERIATQLAEATEAQAAAAELKAEYEEKLKAMGEERAQILEEARQLAAERRDQLLATAKNEASEIKEAANKDINSERERVKDEVYQAIVDISTDMAAKLINTTIDQNAHDKLFGEAMAALEATAFKQPA